VIGYYGGDATQYMEPDAVPWKLLTHVVYAFAYINPDFTIDVTAVAPKRVIGSILEEAQKHNVSFVMSVGGWGVGSSKFSAMVSNQDNRTAFIASVFELVAANPRITGLDIDWEYPGRVSAAGVPYDATNDIPGYLSLLTELRDIMGPNFTLSAPVAGVTPFSSDVPQFADLLDWVVVMEFDFATGPLNETTSNAPLLGSLSGESGVNAWHEAGMPLDKMIYGVPGYGRAFTLTNYNSPSTMGLNNPCSTTLPTGDSDQTANTGVWKWRNLLDEGVLISNPYDTPGVYTGGWDWQQRFDYTTISPYVWNNLTGEFITYDDPVSISYKREFAHKQGMQGMMIWQVPFDSDRGELLHYMN
jgi:chitinase